jgi:hypothetical protein
MASETDAGGNSTEATSTRRRAKGIALSPAAQSELERLNGSYAIRLQQLASKAAQAKNADVISKSDITFAANALGVKIDKKRYKVANDLGAAFIGAALAGIVAIVLADTYTFETALVVGIPLLIGLVLYIYGAAGRS